MNLFRNKATKGVMAQKEQISLPLLQRGNPGAVAAMMNSHGDRLLRAAFCLCRDRSQAQDLVQETFCRAIPALRTFRGDSLLYTWLYSMMRHLFISQARRQRPLSLLVDLPDTAADDPGPEGRAEEESERDCMADILASLPAKHREILMLRFGEEMKLSEIAELLAIAPGTVKSRLHQALKGVRKKMPADWHPAPGREEAYEM
jgi:RNA polymerase sigma-70 factor (ECF subfamily)